MSRLQVVKSEALSLPDAERAALAAELLDTLPVLLNDSDEGIAEALRRDAEIVAEPTAALSWDEMKRRLGR